MSSTRRKQAFYGAAVVAAALAALVTCGGIGERVTEVAAVDPIAPPAIETPSVVPAIPPAPIATPAKKKAAPVAIATKKKAAPTPAPVVVTKKKARKKLRADVDTKDFVVSDVSVSETGYKARIEGYVRLTRKGALAQPLMTFELKDGNGARIHEGTFTPMDASGPAWIGYDELGLKRVPFTTTVDLRADGGVLPAVPPRPYSASVRVADVIDAKPAKTTR